MTVWPRCSRSSQFSGAQGYALLTLLIVVALLGIGLLSAMSAWSLDRQRAREEELLFVGDQYRQAIGRYYLGAPPGTPRTLPPSLEVLLDDDRYPVPVHHLRRHYPDPITGNPDWGLQKVGDQIIGVYSLSEAAPIKTVGFGATYAAFEGATSYQGWVFSYRIPGRRVVPIAPPATSPGSSQSPNPSPARRSPS
jgi:type II secretory pathway pseudopilin PulG